MVYPTRCCYCEDEIHEEDEDMVYKCEECGEIFIACNCCYDTYCWDRSVCLGCIAPALNEKVELL